MSRRRYKKYKKRPPRKSSRSRSRGGKKSSSSLRWIIFLLVIILAGVFVIRQIGKDDGTVVNNDQKNPLEELLGSPGDGTPSGSGTPPIGGGENTGGSSGGEEVKPPVDPTVGSGNTHIPPTGKTGITSNAAKIQIDSAAKDYEAGKVISARNKLNRVLVDMTLSKKDRADVKKWMAKLADEWLFSKEVYEGDTLTEHYKVVSGDLFSTIGNRYKVPYQILMTVNGITDASRLRLGNIKAVKGPFRVEVQLSKYNMDLYLQDMYVKSYKVGIGKVGKETPTGRWRLKRAGKSDQGPTWTDPDTGKTYIASNPDYPLGARWIPITCYSGDGVGETGYALHGTNDPPSIGTKCSRGCIRMHDKDVIEVYNMLMAGKSLVDIVK